MKNDGLASVFSQNEDSGEKLRNAILGYRTLFARPDSGPSTLMRSPACNSVSSGCVDEGVPPRLIAHLEGRPRYGPVQRAIVIYWARARSGGTRERLPEGS